jgi:PAS domain S-box-containing protein
VEVRDSAEAGEARLRLVVEHAPQGVALFDREMRYLFASRRWRDDYGLGQRDLSGTRHYDVFPELPERWREAHQRALAGEILSAECDAFPRDDGRVQWVRWEVRPWREPSGDIGGIIVFSEEITALHEAAHRLEQLYAEAQEAIRLRDDFLSIASHELRTPLTALQLQLQMMRHQLAKRPAEADDAFPRKLEMSTRQVERLTRLVDDLLDVSRISRGTLTLKLEEVDLCEVAREVVERLAPQAQVSGCVISFASPPALMGTWDRLRIEQVLGNLLVNAIKYGAGKAIEVEIEGRDSTVRLSVRDHGIGIGPEDVGRIFGRFERAVSSRNYGGLGLGLYISQQIVDAHGGAIEVESAPGGGSRFTVTVPRRPTRSRARERAA